MRRILAFRNWVGKYKEIYYLLFLLPMTGMTSMGLNSEDRVYMVVFAIATLFLLLKVVVTDYTWQEFLVMGAVTALFGYNFLRGGEKTLILTIMGIFGAKDIDLGKITKYALWEKALFTVGLFVLVWSGIVENVPLTLPKNGEMITILCYGHETGNMAFANIFVVLLLAIMTYGDRLKWYAYVIGTAILLFAYNLFKCRTGMIVWCLLCVMVAGYYLSRKLHVEKYFGVLFVMIPPVLTGITLCIPIYARRNEEFNYMINNLLTGRVKLVNAVYDTIWHAGFGQVPCRPFDSMYFHTIYNYGWWLFVLWLLAYCLGMWRCYVNGNYYVLIALGTMAVYGYMELLPLSILWNLPMLYISLAFFNRKKG